VTVELPYSPVDKLIRDVAPKMRVSSGAAEELAERIQDKGARSPSSPPRTPLRTDGRP